MGAKSCKVCGDPVERPHGNAGYCDDCRHGTCAKCGRRYPYPKPSKPSRYCGLVCARNNEAREYLLEHHGEFTAKELGGILGVTRQRVEQLCSELGVKTKSGWAAKKL